MYCRFQNTIDRIIVINIVKIQKNRNPFLLPFFQEINPSIIPKGSQGIATITGIIVIAKITSESKFNGIFRTDILLNTENQKNMKLLIK